MDELIPKVGDELTSLGLKRFEYELVMGAKKLVRVYLSAHEKIPPLVRSMASNIKTVGNGETILEIELAHLEISQEPSLPEEELPEPPRLMVDVCMAEEEEIKSGDSIATQNIVQGPPGPRGTKVFSGYVPYRGRVVTELPPLDSHDYLIINRGVYSNVDDKWTLIPLADLTMFYDEDKKDFWMMRPATIDKNFEAFRAFSGIIPIAGDLLIDGAKGRIYLYTEGKWISDKRVSLIGKQGEIGPTGPQGPQGPSGVGYETLMVDKDVSIPDRIRTIFVDAGRGNITLTLPKAKCESHVTPVGTICQSPMVTIVNVSEGNHDKVKIKARSSDRIYPESPTVVTRGKSMTYQSYGGVWYVISQS